MSSCLVFRDASVVPSVSMGYGTNTKNSASFSYIKHGDTGPRLNRFVVKQPPQLQRVVALDY